MLIQLNRRVKPITAQVEKFNEYWEVDWVTKSIQDIEFNISRNILSVPSITILATDRTSPRPIMSVTRYSGERREYVFIIHALFVFLLILKLMFSSCGINVISSVGPHIK